MMRNVHVRAYSSSANIGPGFDVLAIAHDAYYDEVWIRIIDGGTGKIKTVDIDGHYKKYVNNEENTAVEVIKLIFDKFFDKQPNIDIKLKIWKGIPVGLGLGSSGATAAATAKALEKILNLHVDYNKLIEIAGLAERIAAGTPHYDNVAASFLGNLVVIYSINPVKVINFRINTSFIVAIPNIEMPEKKTMILRKILPKSINLDKMVKNIGRSLILFSGLINNNIDLVFEGLYDEVIEPYREPYIPCYKYIKQFLANIGIYNVALSGAGPSIIIPYTNSKIYDLVKREILKIYKTQCDIDVTIKVVKPAPGAFVINYE